MRAKKLLVLCIVFVVILTSLAACGSKDPVKEEDQTTKSESNKDGDSKSDITLRMAWWGSQVRHDATIKVIELYESLNPAINIEYEFYDFDGYFTKLNTLVAGNDVWDVFQLGGNFPTYVDKIVPVDDYITNGIIDITNTTDSYLKTTQSDGKQIGMSVGVNCYGVAYDPALFKEAGVPEPTENWTWDEYAKACKTIHEKLGIYGSSKFDDFISGCTMGISQEELNLNFFATSNDKLGFDDPTMLTKYIQMRADLTKDGAYPDPGGIAEIKDIEGDYIVTGDAAMTFVASNQFIALSDAAGRELKLATVPRKSADGPSGSTIQSSQMLCVSKDSKYQEEAAKFIDFFVSDIEANKILAGERGVSIMSNVRENLQAEMADKNKSVYDFVDLIGSFESGEVNPVSPTPKTEIEDQYKILIEQVIYGEKTAQEAANEIYEFASGKFK